MEIEIILCHVIVVYFENDNLGHNSSERNYVLIAEEKEMKLKD